MKKQWKRFGFLSIVFACSFFCCVNFISATAVAAELPETVTVSTGDISVTMCLNSEQGTLETVELSAQTQQDVLIAGATMIYFFLNDEFMAFYFRCDGGEWTSCAEILMMDTLEDCNRLEIHVGEIPAANHTVTYCWGSESKELTVAEGNTAENWTPPAPEGEVFCGWYLDGEAYDFSTAVQENITLTAVYREAVYQITYYIDNAKWESESFEYGTEIELKIPNTKEGFRFAGWRTAEGETVRALTLKGDVRLDAVWIRVYTISYFVNETCVATQTYDEGGSTVAPEDPAATEGYRFLGWYCEDNVFSFGNAINDNVTLTAKFERREFSVTYYLDGEIWKTAKGYYGEKLVLESAESEGYRFIGWKTESGEEIAEIVLTEHVSVYGSREKLTFTVIFDAGEGNFSEGKRLIKEVGYGETATVEPPTLEGHRFLDWDADLTCVTENMTVTARYEKLRFTVTFLCRGEVFLTVYGEYGEGLVLPKAEGAAAPKEGEKFVGWRDSDGETAKDGDCITKKTELMAAYEKIRVPVRFSADGKLLSETEAVYGDLCVLPEAPQKEGYVFAYWSLAENDEAYKFGALWQESEEREFYAVYDACVYAIFYMGENVSVIGPETGKYGERIEFSAEREDGYCVDKMEICYADQTEALSECVFVMPSCEVRIRVVAVKAVYSLEVWAEGTKYSVECGAAFLPEPPERENQIFLGWYTDEEFTREYRGAVSGAYGEVIYLYAKFVDSRITVTLCVGQATFVHTAEYGEMLDESCFDFELPEGYRRKCWRKSGVLWQGELAESDFTLVAELERETFRITFRAGDYEECEVWEYGQLPRPAFVPWEEDASVRFVKWAPEIGEATKDTVYTAVYETLYLKVYYDGDEEVFREQASVSESGAPIPNKEGHTFAGYFLEKQESGILYYRAKYTKNSYALRLTATAGAKLYCEKGVYEYGESVEITASVSEGYRVTGWETNVLAKEETAAGIRFSMPSHDVTVTLKTEVKEVIPQLTLQNNALFEVEGNWEKVASHLKGGAELAVHSLTAVALPERIRKEGNLLSGVGVVLWNVRQDTREEVGFANGSSMIVKFKLGKRPQEKLYLYCAGEGEDVFRSVVLSEEDGIVYASARISASGDYYLLSKKAEETRPAVGWIAAVIALSVAWVGLGIAMLLRKLKQR